MMNRRLLGVLASLALVTTGVAYAGCGSDQTADTGADAGDDGSIDATTDDGGGGDASSDGNGGDSGAACRDTSFPCAVNSECCSGLCDPKSNTCYGSISKCGAAGAACASATDCCTLSCVGGKCGTQCTSDNQPCTTDAECCGGSCTAGADGGPKICKPLNGTCKSSGNTCTQNSECCSKLCTGGTCQIASSYCIQTGDVCVNGADCCGGVCNIAAGANVGTCGLPGVGSSNCNGGVDGTVCNGCTDCCSRVCGPYITGVNICQPANGCHIDGDLCRKDSDCCGGDSDAGLPGSGNVTCEIPDGGTIGICRNPLSCNPEGNVCHYKGGAGSQYACNSSSARNDCCDYLGSKSDCTLDPLGVPRCHVIGSDGGAPCRTANQTCAFTGDCCNGAPCVPGANGELVCYSGPSGSDAGICVPLSGPCTINADCCPGGTCVVPLGGTQGTCDPTTPPPGTDAGTTTTDSGTTTTCALFGQACTTAADCCNGVPCTASDGLSACSGGTGCTCVPPTPR